MVLHDLIKIVQFEKFNLHLHFSTTQKAIPRRASPFVLRKEVIEKCRRSAVRAGLAALFFGALSPLPARKATLCRGHPAYGASAICTFWWWQTSVL